MSEGFSLLCKGEVREFNHLRLGKPKGDFSGLCFKKVVLGLNTKANSCGVVHRETDLGGSDLGKANFCGERTNLSSYIAHKRRGL